MIVMKFGGTSLKDAGMFRKAAEIVLNEPRKKIVVVSAMAKITDKLKELAQEAKTNNQWHNHFDYLVSFNFSLLKDLFATDSQERKRLSKVFEKYFLDLKKLLQSISILHECTLQTFDSVMSLGEIISANVFSALLRESGADSRPVPPYRIRTDDNFGSAEIDFSETKNNLLYLSDLIDSNYIPVIPGFIGKTKDGRLTTLGRNGSDYTAAAIANIFNAEELVIWKDVDGIMQADPKIVPQAKVLERISYEEAMEMTYFGSKVLHPKSILPAIQKKIPIRIKNTNNPNTSGTLISSGDNAFESDVACRDCAQATGEAEIKVITAISNLASINVVGKGMLGVVGIARRVFGATEKAGVNVMMISQASSEQSICFVVRNEDKDKAIKALQTEFELEFHKGLLEDIISSSNMSIIAIIGDGMAGKVGVAAKFFSALAEGGINIIAIAQGSSERNISVLIKSRDVERAAQLVYNVFFK